LNSHLPHSTDMKAAVLFVTLAICGAVCQTAAVHNDQINAGQGAFGAAESKDPSAYYWAGYSHHGIHESMLKDKARTDAYRDAILQNPHLFKDKVVLDVGCGSGILSLFAAKAGAKQVIGIDASEFAHQAQQIVKDNKYDHIITIIKGKAEEIELPVAKVDIIISEWMGYGLLFEAMLNTVLFARDKWLAPGGIMMPDKASLFLGAIEDQDYIDDKVTFWENVYGFNMSSVKPQVLHEPLVESVNKNAVVGIPKKIVTIDIQTVKVEELKYVDIPFAMKARRSDYIHAWMLYFDVEFTFCHKNVRLSTGPHDTWTHWYQALFYLEKPLAVKKGEIINGTFSCMYGEKNPRDLDVSISHQFTGSVPASGSKRYLLAASSL